MSVDHGRNREWRNGTEERDKRNRNQREPRRNFSSQKRDSNSRYVNECSGNQQDHINYRREGGLSPLRSPLRPENRQEMSHSIPDDDRRRYIRPRYSRNERKMRTPEKVSPSSPRSDRYTPEPLKDVSVKSTVKVMDWAEEVDNEENQNDENNRHRRKLEMNNHKNNSDGEAIKREIDQAILTRRQKDIDYGKNTQGYSRYVKLVPSFKRQKGDPATPLKYVKVSRRSWDQQVKNWRKRLHRYDPPQTIQELDNSFDTAFTEISSDGESWDSCSTASEITPTDDDITVSPVEENRCLPDSAMELNETHTGAAAACKTSLTENFGLKERFPVTGFPPLPNQLCQRGPAEERSLDPVEAAQIAMKRSLISYAAATTTTAPHSNNDAAQQISTPTAPVDNTDDNDFFADFDLDDELEVL